MPENNTNKRNGRIWKTIIGVGVALGLVFSVIEYDDRLAKCGEVKEGMRNLEQRMDQKLVQLELETVQTMKDFQKGQQYQQYDYLEDSLTRDHHNCMRELRRAPSDTMLQQECEHLRLQQQRAKEKKESLYTF
jgi:hypothetical protein